MNINEIMASALTGAQPHYVFPLPTASKASAFRPFIQQLYATWMSKGDSASVTHATALQALGRLFPYYGEELLQAIVSAPEKKTPSATRRHRCACGCKALIAGRKQYATPACRQRQSRREKRAAAILP